VNGNIKFVKKIQGRFNEDELKQLCFQLGVEYDDLPSERLSGKALELVKWCDQRNLIDQLSLICLNERPDVDWSDEITRVSPASVMKMLPHMSRGASNQLVGMQLAQVLSTVDYLRGRLDRADIERARVKVMVGGSLVLAVYQALLNIFS
jgi:hypothetical protein